MPENRSRSEAALISIMQSIIKFLRSEEGPTAVEYAVMLAMIVLAVAGSVLAMSNATADSFDESAGQLAGALGS